MAGVGIDSRHATQEVEYLDFNHILGRDNDIARCGIGIHHQVVQFCALGDVLVMHNGELEGNHTVAAISGETLIIVLATFGIGSAIPGVAVARCDDKGIINAVVNDKVQVDDAVAAIDRLQLRLAIGGSRINRIAPSESVACRFIYVV